MRRWRLAAERLPVSTAASRMVIASSRSMAFLPPVRGALPDLPATWPIWEDLNRLPTRAAQRDPLRSKTMKAIQYRSYGGYSENRLVDLQKPSPGDGEVLVAMRTVGINPLDNTFRSGNYYGATPENLPRTGGQTGAGTVVASNSDAFTGGNRVFVRGPGFGIFADGTWR